MTREVFPAKIYGGIFHGNIAICEAAMGRYSAFYTTKADAEKAYGVENVLEVDVTEIVAKAIKPDK